MSLRRLASADVVTVSSYLGESGLGGRHAPPRRFRCRIEAVRQLVRNDSGDETVSETTLFLSPTLRPLDQPLSPPVEATEAFRAESLVTVDDDRRARVLSCQEHRARGRVRFVEVTVE